MRRYYTSLSTVILAIVIWATLLVQQLQIAMIKGLPAVHCMRIGPPCRSVCQPTYIIQVSKMFLGNPEYAALLAALLEKDQHPNVGRNQRCIAVILGFY